MHIPKQNIQFTLMQGMYGCAYMNFFNYLGRYLTLQGYNAFWVGMISTSLAVTAMVFQPISGYLVDYKISVKRLILSVSLLGIPTAFVFGAVASNHMLALLTAAVLSALMYGVAPLIDSWTMRLQEKYPCIDYGFTKGGNALIYGGVSLLMGFVYNRTGVGFMFTAFSIFSVLLFLVTLPVEDIPITQKPKDQPKVKFSTIVKELMCIPEYRLTVLVVFLTSVGFCAGNSFYPVVLTNLGASDIQVSLGMLLTGVGELIFMPLTKRILARIGAEKMLAAGVFLFAVRSFLYAAFSQNIYLFICVQFMQGMTLGFMLTGALAYFSRDIPCNMRASANLVMIGLSKNGLSALVGSLFGGFLADQFGFHISFMMCGVCASAAFVIYVLGLHRCRQKTFA